MTSTYGPTERERNFARHLANLEEEQERGALAALRRGLGKRAGEVAEMHRYIVRYSQGLPQWQEDYYYIVAALFASHPKSWPNDLERRYTNLGVSLRC